MRKSSKKVKRNNDFTWLFKRLIEVGVALILNGSYISININVFLC